MCQNSQVVLSSYHLTVFKCALLYAGIHPHDAKSWMDGYLEELREMARSPECVAVGECGLDYNRDFSPVDIQKEVFEKQVLSVTSTPTSALKKASLSNPGIKSVLDLALWCILLMVQ